jgi:TPR repeat protein
MGQWAYAVLLSHGVSVEMDKALSAKYAKFAADHGDACIQFGCGRCSSSVMALR